MSIALYGWYELHGLNQRIEIGVILEGTQRNGFGRVKRANGEIVSAVSNCPGYTVGWQVKLVEGDGIFFDGNRYSIDCRPYVQLTTEYRAVRLSEKNKLFKEHLNGKYLNNAKDIN
ncbi:hypothetical protein MHO82_13005 [Vibrio sp. Of7-15]|uniref:hypothetical protein n=1 Tax=Vibrio sp. Of7-15 TaxID=2724879 RepID=UPI001EF34E00|nr:hypothetical protein [Vibrio sp. Of7-15]MCG7497783.1 hypothetical protein [Vibrio sp. Of7-15]